MKTKDFDFRNYISFGLPESSRGFFISFGIDPDDYNLPPATLDLISTALDEIAATPEGQDIIKSAADMSSFGEVFIIYQENMAQVVDGGISLGSSFKGRYAGFGSDDMHDTSIQNALFHELYHIAHGHASFDRDVNGVAGGLVKENQTVIATNNFMEKYYGEPRRGNYFNTDSDGTDAWDYNPNFSITGHFTPQELFRNQMMTLPAESFSSSSPEMQSLYEIAEHKKHFMGQLHVLSEDGLMDTLSEELNTITQNVYVEKDIRTSIPGMTSEPAITPPRGDTPSPAHPMSLP